MSRRRIRVIGGEFDPCRTAGLENARDRVVAAEWNRQADPRVVAGAAPAAHDRRRSVPVVPQHAGAFSERRRPTSAATAANTSAGGAARATSVATRRSAA